MSTHRLVEAFDLTDIGAAAKLMAIYIADNGSPEAERITVSRKRMREFCCVIDRSISGLLDDLVWKGFLKDWSFTDAPDEIAVYFAWHNSYSGGAGRRKGPSREARRYVEARDRVCVYCGCKEGPYHIDHITPASRGGSDDVSNLALACATCNISKRDKTPEEWGGKPGRSFTLDRVNMIRAGDA